MPEAWEKFINNAWLKLIAILVSVLFTIVTSYGIYHVQKLDATVRKIQQDKIELIDRINEIDKLRKDDISEVKEIMHKINISLTSFIAKTNADRFTSENGLEVWREISKLQQQVISMQDTIKRNNQEIAEIRMRANNK